MRNFKLNFTKLILLLGICAAGTSFGLATIAGPNPYNPNPTKVIYTVAPSPAQNFGVNSNIALLVSNLTGTMYNATNQHCSATILNSSTFIASERCVKWVAAQPQGTGQPGFKLFLPNAQQNGSWIASINDVRIERMTYSNGVVAPSFYNAFGVGTFRSIGLYYKEIGRGPLFIFKIVNPAFYYTNPAARQLIPGNVFPAVVNSIPQNTRFYGFGGGQNTTNWFKVNVGSTGIVPAGTSSGRDVLTQASIITTNNSPMICEGDEGGPIIDTNDNIYGVIVENPPLAYRQCAVFLGNTAQAQAALGSNIYWFNTATDIDISTIMNYTPAQAIANMAQW